MGYQCIVTKSVNMPGFLIWISVLSGFTIKVVHGVPDVDVKFTSELIGRATARMNWEASSSDFTGITCTFSIIPSGPIFVSDIQGLITSTDASLFSSAGSLWLYKTYEYPGGVYTVTMTFDDSTGTQNLTLAFITEPLPLLKAFSNVQSDNRVELYWTPYSASIQTAYKIAYVTYSSLVPTPQIQEITVPDYIAQPYIIDSLYPPGAKYEFILKTVSGPHESRGIKIYDYLYPLSPALNITTTSTTLIAQWEPPDSIISSYELTYGEANQYVRSKIFNDVYFGANDTSAVVSGLEPGQEYRVWMSGRTEFKASSLRYPQTVTMVPLQIGNISAENTTVNQLVLHASKPVGSLMDEPNVTVIPASSNIDTVLDSDGFYYEITIQGLKPGTSHIITVTSVSGSKTGAQRTATFSTKPATPLVLVRKSATTNSLRVGWTDPPQGNIQSYRLILGDVEITIDGGLSEYTITDLTTPGAAYLVTLYAVSNVLLSEPISGTFRIKPSPPLNMIFSAVTSTSFNVSWDAPEGEVTGYDVEGINNSALERTHTFTGRDQGSEYMITIIAKAGDLTSDETSATVVTLPDEPSDIQIGTVTTSKVTLSWAAPTGGVTGYRHTLNARNNTGSINATVEAASATQSGLYAGETYDIKIWSYVITTIVGYEYQESAQTLNAIVTLVPKPPTDLTVAEKSTTVVRVTWAQPTKTIVKEYKYKIYKLGESSDWIETVVKLLNELVLTGREPGTTNTVEMWTEVDDTSEGQIQSDHTLISFTMVPHPPSNLRRMATSRTTIDIAWNPPNSWMYDRYQLTVTETTTKDVILDQKDIPKGTESYQQTGLDASRTYTFSLVAVSDDEQSETIAVHFVTNSPDAPDLAISEASPSSIGCVWAAMANQVATASQLQLLDVNGQVVRSENFGSNTFEYTFEYLNPGQLYTIEVTITVDNARTTVTKQIVLSPLAVSNFIVIAINEAKVELNWDIDARSHQDEFVIDNKESTYTEQYSSELTKTVVISGLTSGRQYTFTIYAKVTHPSTPSKVSTDVYYTVTTLPIITANMSEDVERTDTNKVVITYTKETGDGEFNNYIFSIVTEDGDKTVTKLRNDTDRVVRFSGLTPGYLYTITARTRSNDQHSAQKSIQVLTVPRKPILTCYEVQSEEITIAIERPIGGITHYKLECVGSNCEQTRTAHPSTSRITYKPLTPFNSYMFTVSTFHEIGTHIKTSDSVKLFCETVESAPQEVGSFDLDVDGYDIIVTWTTPIVTNGVIRNYTLAYVGTKENAHTKVANFTTSARQSSYTFTDLTAGYKYVFTIRAVTVVAGAPKQIEHYFPILEPSVAAQYLAKLESMRPVVKTDPAATELTVSMVNPFTDTNGVIIGYSVIVATSTTKLGDDSTLMNWSDAQKLLFKRPYIAIYKCTDLFEVKSNCGYKSTHLRRKRAVGDPIDIEIGAYKHCATHSALYCNGELQADTAYFILLRAYTETGLYTDTPFSDAIITAKLAGTSQPSNTLTIILAAVLSFVVGCVVVGLIIFSIFRSRRKPDKQEEVDNKTTKTPTEEAIYECIVEDNAAGKESVEEEGIDNVTYEETPVSRRRADEKEKAGDNATETSIEKAMYEYIVADNAAGKESVQEEGIDNVTYEETPVEPTKEAKSQYMALDKPIFYENTVDDASEYYNQSKESTEEPTKYQQLQNHN